MPKPRLFISLLVHEKPEVILDQLKNFKRYAPEAVVVLHLSKGFSLPDSAVHEFKALGQVHINPVQVATNKVNLLYPHFVNLELILQLGAEGNDKVALHASNDMLVRAGVDAYVGDYDAAYFSKGFVTPDTTDSYAKKIFLDEEFAALRKKSGATDIVWSQVEGSFYPVSVLRHVVEQIRAAGFDLEKKRPYFGEEVILPTLAHSLLEGKRIGTPYIFSEVSFLVKYVELRRRFFGETVVAKIFGRLLKMVGPKKITPAIIDRIRRENLGWYKMFGVANGDVRFAADRVFGVKRVERLFNDKLRAYIRSLI